MSKVLAFLTSHKALIGTILLSVGGVLSGTLDLGHAILAITAALSGGLKPAALSGGLKPAA